MSTVGVACPTCQQTRQVYPSGLTLLVAKSDGARGRLVFNCQKCGRVTLDLAERDWPVLACHIRAIKTVVVPAEALEPKPGGPPITHDDVLDFMLDLDALRSSQDLTHALAGMKPGADPMGGDAT